MAEAHHEEGLWPHTSMGADQAGADARANRSSLGGLSWSWDLDLEALVAAVTDPAPWERGSTARTSSAAADPAPADNAAASDKSPPADDADPAIDPDPVEAEFAEYLDAVESGRSHLLPLAVVAGRIAESMPAGPELAVWADAGPVSGLEDGALAGIAASYRRLASWAQAGELAVVAELTARSAAADDRIATDERGCPARIPESASAEISLALTMSQSAAAWWTDLAVTLRWRLAATGAALRAGTIDLARARAIAEATAVLDEDTARAVQDKVLPKAGNQTLGQLRAALRRAVIAADPAGADRRREEAERRARVMLYPDPDGTASLAGYNLPGVPATAAMARITALARALKASGAGGGIDLLRSHVLLGLLLGTLPCIPPPENAPPDLEPPDTDDPPDPGESPPDPAPPGDFPPSDSGADDPPPGLPVPDDDPQDSDPQDDQRHHSGTTGPGRDPGGRDEPGLRDAGHGPSARPPPAWPEIPAFLPPGPPAMHYLPPAQGGLLDLRVPWDTITGHSPHPGYLSRLGPITPAQATHLTTLATRDPAVHWQVVLTNPNGQATATARVRRPATTETPKQAGLIRQVTVIIRPDDLTGPHPPASLPPIFDRILAAARQIAAASAADAGSCAHTQATTAYRPTTRLWDYVTARDLTCRFRTCRQPATRCDLDHTTPFDQGGLTCSCNLGAGCRFHHKIKQQAGWRLQQTTPGTFTWITPTGRSYTTQPDSH